MAHALLRCLAQVSHIGFELPPGFDDDTPGGTAAAAAGLGTDGDVMQPAALRLYLKEKMLQIVSEDAESLLVLPAATLERAELLEVFHEAFSCDGVPEDWFSEKERRECEGSIQALEAKRAKHIDEDHGGAGAFQRFWFEALAMTHFVFVVEVNRSASELGARRCLDVLTLEASCPTLFQQLAVVQAEPLTVAGLVGVAEFYLESPLLTLETWLPANSDFLPPSFQDVSLAASRIFRSASVSRSAAACVGDHSATAGLAAVPMRLPPDAARPGPTSCGLESAVPPQSASFAQWAGEAGDAGLPAPLYQPILELLDLLCLTQSLCHAKGGQLSERYGNIKAVGMFFSAVADIQQSDSKQKLEDKLEQASDKYKQKAAEVQAQSKVYYDHRARVLQLRADVVEAVEEIKTELDSREGNIAAATRELESRRIMLVSFSKADHTELKNCVKQHCPPGGDIRDLPQTPTLILFQLCCIALKIAVTPSREDIRKAMGDPLINTKLAAIDIDTLPAEYVDAMDSLSGETDRAEFQDSRCLSTIAGVIFPIIVASSNAVKLPGLKEQLEKLNEQRESRQDEVDEAERQDAALKQALEKEQAVLQELRKNYKLMEERVKVSVDGQGRIERFMQCAVEERNRWDRERDELNDQFKALVGDCLLSAAAALYLGPYDEQHRSQLLEHWRDILVASDIPCSDTTWEFCEFWMPASIRHRWHVQHKLMPDAHLAQSVVLAMLQSAKWPLLYDPDGIASDFLALAYPKAARLSLRSIDFREKFLAALVNASTHTKGNTLSVDGGSYFAIEPEANMVIIIEDTYFHFLRELDILVEILDRRKLHQGCMVVGAGGDDLLTLHPQLMLIFVTKMGEPLSKDPLASELSLIDFRPGGGAGASHEAFVQALFHSYNPTLAAEWHHLVVDRASLVDDWYRVDHELASMLAHHAEDQSSVADFLESDCVEEYSSARAELTKVTKKLFKNIEAEGRLQTARNAHDPLAMLFYSVSQSCRRTQHHCPHSNFSGAKCLQLVQNELPAAPDISGGKTGGRSGDQAGENIVDSEWSAHCLTDVVRKLWRKNRWGLPSYLQLPAALNLAVSSAVPHPALNGLLARILLACPIVDHGLLEAERAAASAATAASFAKSNSPLAPASAGGSGGGSLGASPPSTPNGNIAAGLRKDSTGSQFSVNLNSSGGAAGVAAANAAERIDAGGRPDGVYPNTPLAKLFVGSELWSEIGAPLKPEVFCGRISHFLQVVHTVVVEWQRRDDDGGGVGASDGSGAAGAGFGEEGAAPGSASGGRGVEEALLSPASPSAPAAPATVPLQSLFKVRRPQSALDLAGIAADADGGHVVAGEITELAAPSRQSKRLTMDMNHRFSSMIASEIAEFQEDGDGIINVLRAYHYGLVGSLAEAEIVVEWTSLRAHVDRLEEMILGSPGLWMAWATRVTSGDFGRDDDESAERLKFSMSLYRYPLLQYLTEDMLLALFPQAMAAVAGAASPQQLLTFGFVQVLLLVVLLSHSFSAFTAGVVAIVETELDEDALQTETMDLRALVRSTTPCQPLVCLCESEACHTFDAICALADADPEGRTKIVPLVFSGVVAAGAATTAPTRQGVLSVLAQSATMVLDKLEEAKDVGYWIVVHLLPGGVPACADTWGGLSNECTDPFDLLERCWFFLSGLSEDSVDDRFRFFVVLDHSSARFLPQWMFGGRSVCLFDGQTGTPLRPWMEQVAGEGLEIIEEEKHALESVKKGASGHEGDAPKTSRIGAAASLGKKKIRNSLACSGSVVFRAQEGCSTVVSCGVLQSSNLGPTELRILVQLLLASLAAGEDGVRGSMKLQLGSNVIGRLDSLAADAILRSFLARVIQESGLQAVQRLRLADLLEPLAVLTLRMDAPHEAGSKAASALVGSSALHGHAQRLERQWFTRSRSMRKASTQTAKDLKAIAENLAPVMSLRDDSRKSGAVRVTLKRDSTQQEEAVRNVQARDGVDQVDFQALLLRRREGLIVAMIEALEQFWGFPSASAHEQRENNDVPTEVTKTKSEKAEAVIQQQAERERALACLAKGLRRMPMVDYSTSFNFVRPDRSIYLLALLFAEPRSPQLCLPTLPKVQKEKKLSPVRKSVATRHKSTLCVLEEQDNEAHESEVSGELAHLVLLDLREQNIERNELAQLLSAVVTCIERSPTHEALTSTIEIAEEEGDKSPIEPLVKSPKLSTRSKTMPFLPSTAPLREESRRESRASGFIVDEGADNLLKTHWKQQKDSIMFWAAAVLVEVKEFLDYVLHGPQMLSERSALKLRHWLLRYGLQAERGHRDSQCWRSVATRNVQNSPDEVRKAIGGALARALPVPEGWNHPSFPPAVSFAEWLQFVAHLLHNVYASVEVPRILPAHGVFRLKSLLIVLKTEVAARLRLNVESIVLLVEPVESKHTAEIWDQLDDNVPHAVVSVVGTGVATPVLSPSAVSKQRSPSVISTDQPYKEQPSPKESSSAPRRSRRLSFAQLGALPAGRNSVTQMTALQPRGSVTQVDGGNLVRRGSGLGTDSSGRRGSGFQRGSVVGNFPTKAARKKSVATGKFGPMRSKPQAKEYSTNEIILTGVQCDGAVWSGPQGLYVSPGIRGLTRLPPLRIRAATPRAAEYTLNKSFGHTHGLLELPLRRVLRSPWPHGGEVRGGVETLHLATLRLPVTWADKQDYRPVVLYDALGHGRESDGLEPSARGRVDAEQPNLAQSTPSSPSAAAAGAAYSVAEARSAGDAPVITIPAASAGAAAAQRAWEPLTVARPYGLHPAVVPLLPSGLGGASYAATSSSSAADAAPAQAREA
eukprot:TRINITY_DN14225_c0_g4_i1.p1 TRINITY_DN14225_c0_g4~~TRINITY_DN14225_c0_g4_i1.p1  ORF type:complete len:2848 (-),score=616.28 TRINITY_DN14225_c0_g4_i1:183-8573(-)